MTSPDISACRDLFRTHATSVLFVTSQLRPRELKMAHGLRRLGWRVGLIYYEWTPFDPQAYFDFCVTAGSADEAHQLAKQLSPRICHVFSGAIDDLVLEFCRRKPAPVVIDLNDVFAPSLFDYCHERFEPTREALLLADGFCARDLQVKSAEHADGFRVPPHMIFFPEYCWNTAPRAGSPEPQARSDEVHVVSVGTFSLETQGMYDSCYLRLAKTLIGQGIHFHIYPHWAYRRDHAGSPHANFEKDFADFLALQRVSPYLHLHDSLPIDELGKVLPRYDFGLVSGGAAEFGQKLGFYYPAYLETCYSGRIADYLDARLPILINQEVKFDYWLLHRYGLCIDLKGALKPGFRDRLLEIKRSPQQRARMEHAAKKLSVDANAARLAVFYEQVTASGVLGIVDAQMPVPVAIREEPPAANVAEHTVAAAVRAGSRTPLAIVLKEKIRWASPRVAKIVLPYRAIRIFEFRLHNALQEIQANTSTIANLQAQVGTQQQVATQHCARMEALEREKTGLISDVADLERRATTLSANLSAAEQARAALNDEVKGLQQVNEALHAQISHLQQDNAALSEDNQRLSHDALGFSGQVQTLTQTKAILNADVLELEKGKAVLRDVVSRLEQAGAELSARVAGLEQDNVELSARIAVSEEHKATLKASLLALEQEKVATGARITELERERSDLIVHVGSLTRERGELGAQVSAMQQERAKFAANAEGLLRENAVLQARLEGLEGIRGALSDSVASLEQDKAGLRAQVAGLEADKATLTGLIAGFEEDKQVLNGQIARSKEAGAALGAQLATLGEERTGLQSRVDELKRDNAALQAELAKLGNEAGEFARRVHVLSNEKFLLQQETRWGKMSINEIAGVLNWPEVLNDVERTNGFVDFIRVLGLFSGESALPDRPSACWDLLALKNYDQLLTYGYNNFKRTIGNNYFNFLVQKGDPQLAALEQLLPRDVLGRCASEAAALGDDPGFPGPDQLTYKYFVLLLWEYAKTVDVKHLNQGLAEPSEGNPLVVASGGRCISQDLANSLIEYCSIGESVAFQAVERVLEIGGGYGRTAYVLLALNPHVKFTMVDIPPALYLAQRYLSSVFKERRVFRAREFSRYQEVREELEAASIVFLMPHQLALMPRRHFDLSLNISSFGEMDAKQVAWYFKQLARVTGAFFYLKQWRSSNNVFDGVVLNQRDYPIPKKWAEVYSRPCRVQTEFFEALYRVSKP